MKRGIFKKRISRSVGGDITLLIFLLFFVAIMMLPLVYAVNMSLKPANELWLFPPKFFAINPTFKNYIELFRLISDSLVPISRYIFNTFLITIAGTGGHIILASMAAYSLSKYRFPGSVLVFKMIRTSLMFSGAVLAVPNYLVMSALGLIDSYLSIIIPAFGSTLGLFLMKQFMDQMIPDELLRSAEIDGASDWVKFWKIVMPIVKPAWLTLMIFSVNSLWNKGATPYIYTESKKTLFFALSQITSGGLARAGVGAAISIIMIAFPLLVFIVSQSNIIETMATSGMKE